MWSMLYSDRIAVLKVPSFWMEKKETKSPMALAKHRTLQLFPFFFLYKKRMIIYFIYLKKRMQSKRSPNGTKAFKISYSAVSTEEQTKFPLCSNNLYWTEEALTLPQRLFCFSLFKGPKTSDKVLQWHFPIQANFLILTILFLRL